MLTYNRARYLRDAIESVLAQSYQNWELVIIDDGSTDNTAEVALAYKDPRIRYVRHRDNAGLLTRRKESLSYVRGTYAAVLDSDDLWLAPHKLKKQVDFLEAHPECTLVGTYIKKIDAQGNNIGTDTYETVDKKIRNSILLRNQFAHSSVLMRTSILKETEGYRLSLAEDLDLFLQLGHLGTFTNIPECLTSHRIHGGSENDRGIKMAKAVHAIIKTYKHDYPHFYSALFMSYLRLLRARMSSRTSLTKNG